MPTYTFRNTETDELHEVQLRMSELDQYKADNPNFTQVITRAADIVDPHRIGLKKPDDSFRDILRNVKSKYDSRWTRTNVNTFD